MKHYLLYFYGNAPQFERWYHIEKEASALTVHGSLNSGDLRVRRGGCWDDDIDNTYLRLGRLSGHYPYACYNNYGFRLARNVD